jgi:hypothetical protein
MQVYDRLLDEVAKAFAVKPSAILGHYKAHDISRARHVWWYLCVQATPQPEYYAAKAGGRRRARPSDGVRKPTARRLGVLPQTLRYAMHRVEDRRDDPQFDALISRLEEKLQAA